MEYLELVLVFLSGLLAASIAWVAALYRYADELGHRVRYRVHKLRCPACRDEETDEPLGYIRPSNPILIRELGGEDELPSFPCTTCEGSRHIYYELPRGQKLNLNERGIVQGPTPNQVARRRF